MNDKVAAFLLLVLFFNVIWLFNNLDTPDTVRPWQTVYNVELKGVIEYNKNYYDFKEVFSKAGYGDTICVHIDSPGGLVSTLNEYYTFMSETKATIVTINEGLAASAAAVIGVQGDYIISKPDSEWLFHKPRLIGIWIYILPSKHYVSLELLRKSFEGRLTSQELKDFFDGKDVIISGKDFTGRLGAKANPPNNLCKIS